MVSLSIIFLRKPVPKMVLYIFPSELFIVFPDAFHFPVRPAGGSKGFFLKIPRECPTKIKSRDLVT